MLAKCANPGCSIPFLYLHHGKLFRWENRCVAGDTRPSFGADPEIKRPLVRVEFFWLCDDCARVVTLVKNGVGITVKPLAVVPPPPEAAPLRKAAHV
jgi:hypothetical protein